MTVELDRSDLTVVVSSVVAAAGLVSSLTFDKTLGTIMTAAGVIVTAIFGYLKARRAEASARRNALDVAGISAGAAIDTNAKTVLVQTVTAERAKWRSELREVVTELTALLRASAKNEEVIWQKVDQLRSGVRLRLNPAGRGPAPIGIDKHEKDRQIHDDLDALDQAGHDGKAQHAVIAERLERHMADILKQEWDVSKVEAVTGKLKTS
jgi:hypothetical protein